MRARDGVRRRIAEVDAARHHDRGLAWCRAEALLALLSMCVADA